MPLRVENCVVLESHEVAQCFIHSKGAFAAKTNSLGGLGASLLTFNVSSDATPIALLETKPIAKVVLRRRAVFHFQVNLI